MIKRILLILLLLYASSLGIRGFLLNDSAKEFARNAAIEIGRDWSEQAYFGLSIQAHGQMSVNEALQAAGKELGRVVSVGDVRCTYDRGLIDGMVGKVISAYCGVDVVYTRGAGIFGMQLIKTKESWKIYQFRLTGKES